MTDISNWQSPLSLLLAAAMLTGAFLLWRYLHKKGRVRRIIGGRWLCASAITVFLVLTAIEGTWSVPLHRNPLMWADAVVIMISLVFTIQDAIARRQGVAGILSHMGLFMVFFGAFWGAPDVVDVQVAVSAGYEEYDAISDEGALVPLPFGIKLQEFVTDYYADGVSPRQYSSDLEIDGHQMRTSVNHPCRYAGYAIYQSGYDDSRGGFSILKLVRDPWLPMVFIGMFFMAAGAVLGLRRCWNSKYVLLAMAALAAVFAVVSLSRISFGTLVPALRSLWFVPHIVLYMLAYSALAIALVTSAVRIFGSGNERLDALSLRLFDTSSYLLLLGMMCGAVWAKAAWGDWWSWDAKECWAAVTWLFTLLGTHLPGGLQKRRTAVFICILLSFAAMQMAWYGVDFLPSAQMSIHVYK